MNNFKIKKDTKIITLSCKFLAFIAKKTAALFSEDKGLFFYPMLSTKTFAINSLK